MNSVAIIGGGFSGTILAVNLIEKSDFPLTIYLTEKNIKSKGLAYSTNSDIHLLNVPAFKMSALDNEPLHFVDWLNSAKERGIINSFQDEDFLPRKLYGQYISELLELAKITAKNKNIDLIEIDAEAIDFKLNDKTIIYLDNGNNIISDKVVLALGNYPPANVNINNPEFYDSPKYFQDPWSKDVLSNLEENEPILLIGSGLTMVDLALSLSEKKYKGKIFVVSPHGYLPEAHEKIEVYPTFLDKNNLPKTCLEIFRVIRKEIKKAESQGINYKSVIDSIRPFIPEIWTGFSLNEKKRFMRYLRHRWGVLRHRMAPVIASYISQLLETNKIEVIAGKIQSFKEDNNLIEVNMLKRNTSESFSFKVQRVINCTGPESNYNNIKSPLIKSLIQQKIINSDPMFLGINATTKGEIIDKANNISDKIFTLGPPLKGILWESTAVPELRVQASKLASLLLSQIKEDI